MVMFRNEEGVCKMSMCIIWHNMSDLGPLAMFQKNVLGAYTVLRNLVVIGLDNQSDWTPYIYWTD